MKKFLRIVLALSIILQVLVFLPAIANAEPLPATGLFLGLEANEYTSCPFLYTYDGTGYITENDLISVGRNKINEYTDYLFLNNAISPIGGKIAMQVKEIPGEKSSLDFLQLTRVNHPVGTKAGVDAKGLAHTYIAPAAPIQAFKGAADILPDIATDNSNGTLLYDNQSIDLTFAAADLTNGAKLVLKVQGYQHNESIPEVIAPKVPAILVQTPDGAGGWITRGTFYPKQLAAIGVFDLQGVIDPANPQVRLLSVSCNQRVAHLIDYVGLDNSADQLTTTVLPLSQALKNGTVDVRSALAVADGQYAALSGKATDQLDLQFTAGAAPAGLNDYFFTSKGYYELEGNTFYVDTMDNAGAWTNRIQTEDFLFIYGMSIVDRVYEYDLTAFKSANLPKSDGTIQVKVRNVLFNGSYGYGYAYLDQAYLKLDGVLLPLISAMTEEETPVDVMTQVGTSDDNKLSMMNKTVILTFQGPIPVPASTDNFNRRDLYTELISPVGDIMLRTTDMNYKVSVPEQWDPRTSNIKIWLEATPSDLEAAKKLAIMSAGQKLVKSINVKVMMKITYTDGTSITKEVDNSYIKTNITVMIPIDDLKAYKDLGIVYIDPSGKTAVIASTRTTIDGIEYISFENNNFSQYGIFTTGKLGVQGAGFDIPKTGENDFTNGLGILMLLTSATLAYLVIRKRRSLKI
jgi:LPXTG-motif cell wall-anchored protein